MERDHMHCLASYRTLRRVIGWAGLLMPVIVRCGAWLTDGVPATDSLSAYYYTSMRDVFVSTTVLTGVLLMCYRTGQLQDTIVASLAGIAAIGLALCPMNPAFATELLAHYPQLGTGRHAPAYRALDYHLLFAIDFAALSFYLVAFRFGHDGPQEQRRKRAYQACGGLMLLSYATMLALAFFADNASFYWPETCAVTALALAWLVKGDALLSGTALPKAAGPALSEPLPGSAIAFEARIGRRIQTISGSRPASE